MSINRIPCRKPFRDSPSCEPPPAARSERRMRLAGEEITSFEKTRDEKNVRIRKYGLGTASYHIKIVAITFILYI